ncbi:MAG: (deoxy)nucleoside triphosphate pyrophosphohydrolase [Peptostreptococcaceae bacterium]|nr:(deoxy)nucleoside triphosphate pyrophosphohydrolase [Peptostreptococcaceae bacterium]
MKQIEVVAGIIMDNDKILCVQRGAGKYDYISYKFEFPGGKVELNENGKEALRRELLEEMRLDIKLEEMEHFIEIEHEYKDFKVLMNSYICRVENPEFELLEHIDGKWLLADELLCLDWAEADIPIVNVLIQRGKYGCYI